MASTAPDSTPAPRVRLLHRLFAAAVLLLAIILTVPWDSYSPVQSISDFRLLDGSWQTDIPGQLAHGRLLGRDFVFTYGPLYQWMHAAGLVIPPGDAASVMRWHGVPEKIITITLAWLILRLTGAPLAWRATTFLAWSLIVAAPGEFGGASFKPMGGLALGVICGYLLAHAAGPRTARGVVPAMIVLWAITAPILTLYSFEFGVFAAAALVVAAVVIAASTWGFQTAESTRLRRLAIWAAAAALVGGTLFVGLTELPTAWQGFLRDQAEIARGYSLAMARGATWPRWSSLLALAVLLVVLAAWLVRRQRSLVDQTGRIDRPGVALFCGAMFSLVFLRYGLTRSELLHWWGATAPSMYLLGILLPAYLIAQGGSSAARFTPERPWWRAVLQGGPPDRAGAALPIGCLVVFVVPFALTPTFSTTLSLRVRALADFRLASPRLAIDQRRELIPEAIAALAALPEKVVYIWPYEAIFGFATDKINPAYTVQSYSAHTAPLEQVTIEQLKTFADLPVLVCRTSRPVDDVPGLTRTPLIFRFLLDRFELAEPPTDQIALLRPAPAERSWSLEPVTEIAEPFAFKPGMGRGIKVKLDDARLSDLLVVRLRAAPTPTWGIGKPGHVILLLEADDAPPVIRKVLVPPDGQFHNMLVSALGIADPLFMTKFVPDRQWRSTERVTGLAVVWQPIDVLSVRPDEIALEGVAVLRPENVEILETSVDQQEDPAVWRWCYLGEPLPAEGAP